MHFVSPFAVLSEYFGFGLYSSGKLGWFFLLFSRDRISSCSKTFCFGILKYFLTGFGDSIIINTFVKNKKKNGIDWKSKEGATDGNW